MSKQVANAFFIGRITKDVEAKRFQDDKVVCNFTVANDRGNDNGANFFRCNVWGKQAEVLASRPRKGELVFVFAEINTGEYEKNGVKVPTTDYRVINLSYLSAKGEGAAQTQQQAAPQAQAPTLPNGVSMPNFPPEAMAGFMDTSGLDESQLPFS